MPARKEMPSTVERSPKKAQDTWVKTHDSAVESYGEGERAHRTAFSSLKHSFEKVGDHWEPKEEKGPSDPQAARSGARARRGGRTAEGVDANASKKHLYELADMVASGARAALVYVIQMQAERFDVARDIDPAYDKAFRYALNAGVESYAFRCKITPAEVAIDAAVPIVTPL